MTILVTGASGFLGQHLKPLLKEYDVYSPSSQSYDLRHKVNLDTIFRYARPKPNTVIHLAADVGGIGYNLKYPARIYFNNVMMNTHLIHTSAIFGVKKFIFVSSVCAYPQKTEIPTKEEELFNGPIEYSNRSYGLSKLIALQQLRAYKKQYGMDFSYPILANLYGPKDRGFSDPGKAHLIPNLIKQFMSQDKVTMLGDGSLTRDLLYVEDAARALVRCLRVDYDKPVNIATGQETSKREIADAIVEILNYKGEVTWDNQPDKGEKRRCYDVHRAKDVLSWQAQTGIKEGLQNTIKWYKIERD